MGCIKHFDIRWISWLALYIIVIRTLRYLWVEPSTMMFISVPFMTLTRVSYDIYSRCIYKALYFGFVAWWLPDFCPDFCIQFWHHLRCEVATYIGGVVECPPNASLSPPPHSYQSVVVTYMYVDFLLQRIFVCVLLEQFQLISVQQCVIY